MAVGLGTIYAELGLRLDKFDQGLQEAEAKIKQTEERFEGFEQAGKRLSGIGKGLTLGVTLPIAGIATAALKMGKDFGAAMADVATLIPGNVQRVEELKTAVQAMAIETGKRTGDLTRGLYQVISAFGDTADTALILETNARAAAAGLATTEQAIALTSAITKGYGDTSAEAVTKVADLALLTVRLGQTTFPELAGAMGRVTPIAAAMGVSMEDLFAVMATLTGTTGNAVEVSTQLRSVLQGLMRPSKDMQGALESMGYASGTAALEAIGLEGVLQKLAIETKGNQEALVGLWGQVEAGVAVLALTGGQADTLSQRLQDMKGYAGTTDEAFAAMTTGVGQAAHTWGQLIATLEVAAQQIGDILLPIIGDLVTNYIMPAVQWFSSLDDGTKRVIVTVALLVASIGPVLVVLGTLLGAVTKIAAALPLLKAAFLLLTGPIGLVVAAVVAMIAIWARWGDDIRRIVGAAAEAVRERLIWARDRATEVVQGLRDATIGRFESMVARVREIFSGIVEAIAGPIRRASEAVSGTVEGIRTMLNRLNPFARSSPSLVDNIRAGVKAIQTEYGKLEDLQVRMPAVGVGLTPTPAVAGTGVFADGAPAAFNGPLVMVQNMSVRSDADIEAVSRQLHRHIQASTKARGGR